MTSETRSLHDALWDAAPAAATRRLPRYSQMLRLAFLATDFLSPLACFAVAIAVYNSPLLAGLRYRVDVPHDSFVLFGAGVAFLQVFFFSSLGLYMSGVSLLNVEEDVAIVKGHLSVLLLALATSFVFMRDEDVPRLALVLALVLMLPLTIMCRRVVRSVGSRMIARGVAAQPVVIYGADEVGCQLADRLFRNPQLGMKPMGFLSEDEQEDGVIRFGEGGSRELPVLGRLQHLPEAIQAMQIQNLFIATPELSANKLAEVQEYCRNQEIGCYYVPLSPASHFRRTTLMFVGDIPVMCERMPVDNPFRSLSKRLLDLLVAGTLLVLASPVMLLAAVLIKLTSRGPIIFKQERIGRWGKPFFIYKFRTMYADTPAYAKKPSAHDRRVTTLGRILRRTSIDELPQLLNVLKGEMSMVGPRPDMPHIVAQYNPIQRERLMVLPGLTGLWQISGDRNFPIHDNVDYDLYYLYNQSVLLDLVVIVRTAFCFFRGQ